MVTNKMKSIFVFVPSTLNMTNIGFVEGFCKKTDGDLAFYITNDKIQLEADNTIGYCSSQSPFSKFTTKDSEWLHINNITHNFKINEVDSEEYDEKFTVILYDLDTFANCDITTVKLQNYGGHFEELCMALHKSNYKAVKPRFMIFYIVFMFLLEMISEIFRKGKRIFRFSSVLMQVENGINLLKWGINSMHNSEKVSVKLYNCMLAKAIDLVLGFVLLYIFFEYESEILKFLNVTVETVIHGLKNLLIFLMGSPIGLKLNYAFNKILGTFFFYHIFLWKTFMHFLRPYLYSILYLLLLPASFGLSFQAAVVEDLVKICTVHVYCIYIYAARLYGLQINALLSLWRLFIGRKYNPLRDKVDSLEYNNNQLFIGILGFTIFLFLLPTTLLYYVVFAVFRLCVKIFMITLVCLRGLLQCLPVYSIILWVFNSPLIAASIIISVKSDIYDLPVVLHVELQPLPLVSYIRSTAPPCLNFNLPKIGWYEELMNILMGKLM